MVLSRSISEFRRLVCRIGEGTGRWRSGSGRTLCGLGRINLRATCGISLLIIWQRVGSIGWHIGKAFFSTFSAGAGLPSGDGICRIRGVCGSRYNGIFFVIPIFCLIFAIHNYAFGQVWTFFDNVQASPKGHFNIS